ncbi:hypothetical protein OSTOST_05531 [Ostertagia ostertagi]
MTTFLHFLNLILVVVALSPVQRLTTPKPNTVNCLRSEVIKFGAFEQVGYMTAGMQDIRTLIEKFLKQNFHNTDPVQMYAVWYNQKGIQTLTYPGVILTRNKQYDPKWYPYFLPHYFEYRETTDLKTKKMVRSMHKLSMAEFTSKYLHCKRWV